MNYYMPIRDNFNERINLAHIVQVRLVDVGQLQWQPEVQMVTGEWVKVWAPMSHNNAKHIFKVLEDPEKYLP